MMWSSTSPPPPGPSRQAVVRAYGVHLYTALGAVVGLLTAIAIFERQFATAFWWMAVAVFIDATDGFFARRFRVKRVLPQIDGRRLDDIVDYLNYTFLPLLLIWRGVWVPQPAWLWIGIPLVASLFTFCHAGAKEEDDGFFRGFPSYWNIVAFYTAVLLFRLGPWSVVAILLGLSLLSVLPVRFVYPNLAVRWRGFFLLGGVVWALLVLLMIAWYPAIPFWLTGLSLVYPLLYLVLSVYLDWARRKPRSTRA